MVKIIIKEAAIVNSHYGHRLFPGLEMKNVKRAFFELAPLQKIDFV
jgi:hypothetical protein